jgi:glyoxylase-like metal-dependent hydrolase (beta-lactamase superfamily II)
MELPMKPTVETFFHQPTWTACHLVWDPATRMAVVIDPPLDFDAPTGRLETTTADAIIARAHELGLTVAWVLETHAHADHLSAADVLRQRLGAKVAAGERIVEVQRLFAPLFAARDVTPDGSAFDRLLADGERLALGDLSIEVIGTPGHTPACVSYRIGDAVFVGDTLFMPDFGTARCDFPGGDARTLYRSIRRLLDLPPSTRMFVGHDYLPKGRTAHAWETTVAAQREASVHVRDGIDEAAFVAARTARDRTLSAPSLILPSLQVNIRAGALPPPAPDGTVFLLLPVNRLGGASAA